MSSNDPPARPEQPSLPARPSLMRESWTLGKVVLGVGLIAFGCWRLWAIAFGPDESLLFGYRVRAASAAKQAQLLKEQNRALRELNRTVPDLRQRADRVAELQKVLEARLAEQAELDRRGYRTERWMELFVVAFTFTTGPGLAASGRSVLWVQKSKQAEPLSCPQDPIGGPMQ